jgi:hypothetical protein
LRILVVLVARRRCPRAASSRSPPLLVLVSRRRSSSPFAVRRSHSSFAVSAIHPGVPFVVGTPPPPVSCPGPCPLASWSALLVRCGPSLWHCVACVVCCQGGEGGAVVVGNQQTRHVKCHMCVFVTCIFFAIC